MKKIILLAICLIGLNSCCSSKEEEIINAEESNIKLKVDSCTLCSFYVARFSYEGHSYIGFRNNWDFSVVHDPDCKCLKEKEEKPQCPTVKLNP